MNMTCLSSTLIAALLLLATSTTSWAALSITLSPSSINFNAQDPDLFPTIQANQTVSLVITTSNIGNRTWYYLTIQARGDLLAPGATIPISAVTWQAVETGGDRRVQFTSGTQTLTRTPPGVEVMRGRGNDESLQARGNMTFFVQNSWTQAAGTYTQTADLTLSAP